MGGANDINKNEVNVGLKHLELFVKHRQNTNIMIVTALHKYDLEESSCVNREIEVFNRKLHKVLKTVNNVQITLVNKIFVPRKVYCVSNVTFHAKSKYAIKILQSPTVFVQWHFYY
jgi:hypothetical protein